MVSSIALSFFGIMQSTHLTLVRETQQNMKCSPIDSYVEVLGREFYKAGEEEEIS